MQVITLNNNRFRLLFLVLNILIGYARIFLLVTLMNIIRYQRLSRLVIIRLFTNTLRPAVSGIRPASLRLKLKLVLLVLLLVQKETRVVFVLVKLMVLQSVVLNILQRLRDTLHLVQLDLKRVLG